MAAQLRTPWQGVTNIIRFNWHFYVIGPLFMLAVIAGSQVAPTPWSSILLIISALTLLSILVSLGVSWYVYDRSGLYDLEWLKNILNPGTVPVVATFNAGFDETSHLIITKFPGIRLQVYDFYDPARHTEVSIERARRAYPPFPGTITVKTDALPLEPQSLDLVLLLLAAHEIRNREERIDFLTQLRHSLRPGGQVLVMEHLRDLPNFLAYTFGFFHFLPRRAWLHCFAAAGFAVKQERTHTPFIHLFTLEPHGVTP